MSDLTVTTHPWISARDIALSFTGAYSVSLLIMVSLWKLFTSDDSPKEAEGVADTVGVKTASIDTLHQASAKTIISNRERLTKENENVLDAVIIIFNRDFSPKDTYVNSILTKMIAKDGLSYRHWLTKDTPVRVLVHPNAQDPLLFTIMGVQQFRSLGISVDYERLTSAKFEGSYGVSGVIVSHWKVF